MFRRRAVVVLAAAAAVLGAMTPAVAAPATPKASVLAWARPAGPLVASATSTGTYAAVFATSSLTPDRYVITLPEGATRPTRVATSLLLGCRTATPVIGTGTGGRWTISVALSCSRTTTSFTARFATALTRAGAGSFGWSVSQGSSPVITGSLGAPTVTPAPLASVAVAAAPTSLVADGTSQATLTASARDAFGNPVAASFAVVNDSFAVQSGTPEPASDPAASAFTGSTATLAAGTRLGSWTGAVRATQGSRTATSAPVSIALTPGPLANLSAALSFVGPLEADGSAAVSATITATDAQGRRLAQQAVTAATDEPGASTPSPVVDNNDGTYSTGFTVGTTPGSYTFSASSGAVTTTVGYTTQAPAVAGVLTRGEAPPAGDYWSSRDGAPILAGSTYNSFRVTFVAPRQLTGADVTFTVPAGVGAVIGRAFSGTCDFSGGGILRLDPATQPGAVVTLVGIDCGPGDTASIDFTAQRSTPFVAGSAFPFQTELDYFVGETPVSETTTSSFTVVPTGHSVAIDVGPKQADDPYTRTITLRVLGADGQLDTGFQGAVEFGRARCGFPAVPGDGELAFNPGWTAYQAVDGLATFAITSPDKDITPFSSSGVFSPTSTDTWLARTADADSLAAAAEFELGPDGGPGPGTFTCPTRGIF